MDKYASNNNPVWPRSLQDGNTAVHVAVTTLTHDTGELAPAPSYVLASRIQRLELEHMKKCKTHSMKIKATPNMKTSAVKVAFCSEFMPLWSFLAFSGPSANRTWQNQPCCRFPTRIPLYIRGWCVRRFHTYTHEHCNKTAFILLTI